MCFPLAFAGGGSWAGKGRTSEYPDMAVVVCVGRVTTWAEQTQACHLVWYHLLFSSRKQDVISMHDRADIKHGIWSGNGEFLFFSVFGIVADPGYFIP